jgi:fumarate reductase subunit C
MEEEEITSEMREKILGRKIESVFWKKLKIYKFFILFLKESLSYYN